MLSTFESTEYSTDAYGSHVCHDKLLSSLSDTVDCVCLSSKQRKGPLSLQDFRLIAVLGRGHFGKVQFVTMKPLT